MEALCWIDIETTGLDPKNDLILEVGCRITDFSFETLHEFHFYTADKITFGNWAQQGYIDQVVLDMHRRSGLFEDLPHRLDPDHMVAINNLMTDNIQFAMQQFDIDKLYPAGSSVHFDMSFILAEGLVDPKLLSHRHFDVTTLKLFMQTQTGFYPEFEDVEPKHRALSDIQSSINVAKIICAPMMDTSLKASHTRKVIEGND